MECKNCQFYLTDGKCHRNPPTLYYDTNGDGLAISDWPKVRPDDDCGECKRKIGSI